MNITHCTVVQRAVEAAAVAPTATAAPEAVAAAAPMAINAGEATVNIDEETGALALGLYMSKDVSFLHTTILTMCTAKKVNLKIEAKVPLRCRLG
jgi:hypothetical protein